MRKWPRLVAVAATVPGSLFVAAVGGADRVDAAGTITGKVFRDYNSNGVMNTTLALGVAVDVGVAGIEVRGFDANGSLVGQTATGAGGTYTLSVTGEATNQIRVEFSIPQSNPALAGLQSSVATTTGASGSSFGTSIQFATVGNTNVDYAVNVPGEYCQNNPTLVTCAAEVGTGTSSGVGAFTFGSAMSGFTDFTATSSLIGSSDDLGSVFGIGTDRHRNSYFGTYLRRHSPGGDDTVASRQRPVDASDYVVDLVHWRIARTFDAGSWHVRVDVRPDGVDVVDAGAEACDPNCPLVGTLAARDPWGARFEALYLAAYSGSVRLTVDDAGIHRTRVRPDASVFGEVPLDAADIAERIRAISVQSPVAGMTVEVRDHTDPSGPRHVATLRFERTIRLPGVDPIDDPITARRVA